MALKLASVATRVDCFGVSVEELVCRQNNINPSAVPPTPNSASANGGQSSKEDKLELPRFLEELLTYIKKKGALGWR